MQSVLVLVETPQGLGTGLIVEGGYIVTSYRLVGTYEAAQVTSSAHDLQGRTVPLVAWEPRTDLAVLGPVDVELEALPIAESAATPVGTIIFLAAYEEAEIGVPTLTIVPGRLTSVHTPDPAGPTYVLTNAYIEAGRSSGVIIDFDGTLRLP
ncbi:S1 family peptidase [Candidatus Poriferisodalis sp.]|uniref:S1 family peptidase n=1 Tax=Candidatus Poriferisodalis sp. TaxID=3101277 RepID=UPI003B5215EC